MLLGLSVLHLPVLLRGENVQRLLEFARRVRRKVRGLNSIELSQVKSRQVNLPLRATVRIVVILLQENRLPLTCLGGGGGGEAGDPGGAGKWFVLGFYFFS